MNIKLAVLLLDGINLLMYVTFISINSPNLEHMYRVWKERKEKYIDDSNPKKT